MTSRKRRSSKRRPQKRVSVNVIAAIIATIGVIVAAVIGIFPQLLNSGSKTDSPISESQGVFNKYDDPLGVFSIEYPYEYAIDSRKLSENSIQVSFLHNEALSPDAPWGAGGGIYINISIEESPLSDISELHDSVSEEFIENSFPYDLTVGLFDNAETKLVSSERRENGFFIHTQIILTDESPPKKAIADSFVLFEYENRMWAQVIYLIGHDSVDTYRDSIEHTFSSFSWSPQKLKQYFNQ